jgi:hypothetical protein
VNDVRQETAGMQRKILGSWKQYSGRGSFRFFQWIPTNSRVSLQDPVAGTIALGDDDDEDGANSILVSLT